MKPAALGAIALGAIAAGAGAVLCDTAPYPYAQRHLLDVPLPLLTRRRLDVLLQPRAGEQVLEIGPGTGLQALHVARNSAPVAGWPSSTCSSRCWST